jgi:CSLREA domain-containing protein
MKTLIGPTLKALRLGWLLVFMLALLASANAGHAAAPLEQQGATIFVNTPLDLKQSGDNKCSLREAIIAANSNKRSGGKANECAAGTTGMDTIDLYSFLPAGTTLVLTRSDNGNEDSSSTGDLDIFSNVKIVGRGFGQTTVNSSGISDRAFQILAGGTATIEGVVITKNGGTVASNGGGIRNSGNLTLINSTVTNNRANGSGGGIYNDGVLAIFSSTIDHNTANSNGGGLANASSGSVSLTNSTVSNNTGNGGGIFNQGILALHSSTIAFNTGSASNAGGVANAQLTGAVNFRNTIIAGNGPDDCSGVLVSQGYNLDSDGTCVTNSVNNDITTSSPGLGALDNNGGPTLTHALLAGSPAIDAGDPNGCFGSTGQLAFDQRSEPRPEDGDSNGSLRCDMGAFELGRADNSLVLLRAFPNNGNATMHGLLDGASNATINVNFFSDCQGDAIFHAGSNITTDENGYFIVNIENLANPPSFVTAKTTAPSNGQILVSNCVPFSDRNDDWPGAFSLTPNPVDVVDTHYIDGPGQSRWYKFKVQPSSDLTIILSGTDGSDDPLPADYDLTLYKDLQAAFDTIVNPTQEDIVKLSAQYAGGSYSGGSYSGGSYSGGSYSGGSYSGGSYSGGSYSGGSYSGGSYSGGSYSGGSYSGGSYSGDAYIGGSYSGGSYSGGSYSGGSYSGGSYSSDVFGGGSYSEAYSDAQLRSLLAVSAIGGTAPETMFLRTWNSDEFYYLRVRSGNGEFSLAEPFRLEVRLEASDGCGNIDFENLNLPATSLSASGNDYETLILTDDGRMANPSLFEEGGSGELAGLQTNLAALAQQTNGVIVNVGADDRVSAANDLADANPECPFAKNLVAEAVKKIVDDYKEQNPLKYLVIVGNDNIISFNRHPDFADLAKESQFVPPVLDSSASQAALRLDFVLSDDDYVAKEMVPLGNSTFPIVDSHFAAGRLVETAADMNAVIEAFLSIGGLVEKDEGAGESWSTLVTGYDFLEDASLAIRDQLNAATNNNNSATELITSFNVPPTDPSAWAADDLRAALLGSRHDLVFLAGHFSGNSALAADYASEVAAIEVTDPTLPADLFSNTLIFSIGCHSGYNIVDQDGIPGVTGQPDWASAFAGQGATLIGGTGYQYGETLTQEYSERLYIEFSKRLRLDTGAPVSIGHALNQAKLAYISQVPSIRGTHEKSLLESTVFGLPMLSFDLPGRFTPPADQTVINASSLNTFATNPGAALGLQYVDLPVTSPLNKVDVPLTDIDTKQVLPGEFLSGNDGEVTFPTEPFLPLESENVTVPGTALRGVGFRGGAYQDEAGVLPVTGAPTTEAIALHLSWQTPYFHPTQMHNSNYLGALIDGQQRILFTPAQHMADPATLNDQIRLSIRRKFSQMNYRLFYSNNVDNFGGHIPAFSTAPAIVRVSAIPGNDEIVFRMMVVGDPSAGMQAVWVTWTAGPDGNGNGVWQSLDLTQRENDTRVWEGTLPLNGMDPDNIRYIVQAVNGFGLVTQALNDGAFFTPGDDTNPTTETTLALDSSNPSSGLFQELVEVSAVLQSSDGPLSGQIVEFKLGPGLSTQGITDSTGRATTMLTLVGLPGPQKLYASFAGKGIYKSSSDVADFTIEKQQANITGLVDTSVFEGQNTGVVITLLDEQGEPLREQGVFIVVSPLGDPETPLHTVAGITNLFGQVSLGTLPATIGPGEYTVTVYFNDSSNPLTVALTSDAYNSDKEAVTLTILESPCTAIATPPEIIWQPNHTFTTVSLSDPSGLTTITITGIFQDEPVGNNGPDGTFIDNDTVELRAERNGGGNGRVYHLFFTADDGQGFTCTGELAIAVVEHDQSGNPITPVDEGPLYDSTGAGKFAPEAVDDTATTNENSAVSGLNVLANDIPAKPTDTLTVSAVNGNAGDVGQQITLASGALLTLGASGGYSYNPNGQFEYLAAGAVTTDTFDYTVSDNDGDSDIGTVIVTINGVNDAPIAVNDTATTTKDTVLVVGAQSDKRVLLNDTDVDGDLLAVTAQQITLPSGALLTLNADGTYTYSPPAGFTGNDAFTYTISDGHGGTDSATVTITVIAANQPPVANNDAASVSEDDTNGVNINVAANDTDVDGNLVPSSVTIISSPVNGAVVNNGDGTVKYTPTANFNGLDTFTYRISDSDGLASNTATVSITVNPVPDAPVANDDSATLDTTLNSQVVINVIANDTDIDGDLNPASVTVTSNPANGSAVSNGDGTVTYTPTGGFLGTDSFNYEVCDSANVCDTAAVTVTVTGNTPPVAVNDAFSGPKGNPITGINPILSIAIVNGQVVNGGGPDTDPDGDTLTVIASTNGSRGTVTSNNDGTLTYTPGSNYKGTDTFTYTISDGKGGTAVGTVTITME